MEEEANRLADYEEKLVNEAIQPFLPGLQGKRVLICGGVVRAGQEARVLKELGLDVIAVRAYHYDNNAEEVYSALAEELPDVPLAISNQLFELANQIHTYKPDLAISHAGTQGWLAKMGVASMQIFSADKVYFGYSGLFSLLKRMLFVLKNPSFQNRLARNVKSPYKADWFTRDAFSYLKG